MMMMIFRGAFLERVIVYLYDVDCVYTLYNMTWKPIRIY